jgi:hypothetical protein
MARGRARALAAAGVFAAALFVGSGTAVSDITPTTPAPTTTVPTSTVPTSTNPVTAVTLLPTPKKSTTPTAKPDPVPVPQAKPKTTPKAKQTYTPPVTTPTKTVTVTKPKVTVHKPTVKKVTHHAAPPKKIVKPVVTLPVVVLVPPLAVRTARPVVTTPVPAPAPRPVRATKHGHGTTWIVPIGGGLLLFLLVLGLIVASEKGLFKAIAAWRERRRVAAVTAAAAAVPAVAGAPVLRIVDPLPEEAAAPEQPESCRITWWRDADKSQFYACMWTGAGMVMNLIAESPVFPWPAQEGASAAASPEAMLDEDEPPPQSDDAVIAYAELVQLLGDLGWEPELMRSDAWFHATFRYIGVEAAESVSAATA